MRPGSDLSSKDQSVCVSPARGRYLRPGLTLALDHEERAPDRPAEPGLLSGEPEADDAQLGIGDRVRDADREAVFREHVGHTDAVHLKA